METTCCHDDTQDASCISQTNIMVFILNDESVTPPGVFFPQIPPALMFHLK